MRNHTQKPTNSVSPKSIFYLVNSNRETIATDLSIEQVAPIANLITGSVIKFQRMEVTQ